MPTYTIKEIADLIEKPAKTVEVYCVRKKLIKNSDKKIDTSNPINELFLAKYIVQNNTVQSDILTHPPPESKPDSEKKNGKDKSVIANAAAIMEVDYAIKKLNAERIQKDIQLKDIEIKKKNNELVESIKITAITKAYTDNLKKQLAESMESLIQDICSRYEIPSDKAGSYLLKVTENINYSSKKAVNILRESNIE